jgi:hypothetical protein
MSDNKNIRKVIEIVCPDHPIDKQAYLSQMMKTYKEKSGIKTSPKNDDKETKKMKEIPIIKVDYGYIKNTTASIPGVSGGLFPNLETLQPYISTETNVISAGIPTNKWAVLELKNGMWVPIDPKANHNTFSPNTSKQVINHENLHIELDATKVALNDIKNAKSVHEIDAIIRRYEKFLEVRFDLIAENAEHIYENQEERDKALKSYRDKHKGLLHLETIRGIQ